MGTAESKTEARGHGLLIVMSKASILRLSGVPSLAKYGSNQLWRCQERDLCIGRYLNVSVAGVQRLLQGGGVSPLLSLLESQWQRRCRVLLSYLSTSLLEARRVGV